MSIHDYSNGAVTEFRNSMLNLEAMVNDFTLTTEGMEFAWEDGIVEAFVGRMTVALINDIKKDLRNLFDSAGGTAIVTAGHVAQADETAAGQFDEILRSMTLLENAVKGAAAVQNRCTGTKFTAEPVCADAEEIMEANAVVIRLPEYINKNEDGSYTYQYDKIHELVQKGSDMSDVDVRIVASVTMTTAEGEEINTSELNRILEYDGDYMNAACCWKKVYAEMRQRVEFGADYYGAYLTMSPEDLQKLSKEEQQAIKNLKNAIDLTEVVGAVENGYWNMTSEKYLAEHTDLEGVEGGIVTAVHRSKYGNIHVEALEHNDSYEMPRYIISTGSAEYAMVAGFSYGDSNCQMLEDEIIARSSADIKNGAERFKKDCSQSLDDYVKENWNEDEAFMNVVKKIPIAGDVVGMAYDYAMATGYAIESAAEGELHSEKIIEHAADGTEELLSTVKTFSGGDIKKAAGADKDALALCNKAQKAYYSKQEVIDDYYEQQRENETWNQQVDDLIISKVDRMQRGYAYLSQLERKFNDIQHDHLANGFNTMTLYLDDYRYTSSFECSQPYQK